MDIAITIVMLVPVLLAVALIIGVIRRNITERQAGDPVDISGAIPAVIVLMVAVLIIVAMGNAASPYVYDEDSGELKIQQNVPQLDVQPWDSYASDVKSLVIQDGVTSIGAGAFDTLTGLEYVSIPATTQVSDGAFSIDFLDPYGEPVTEVAGKFAVYEGAAYLSDPTLYKYYNNTQINGFANGVSGVVVAAFPTEINGLKVTAIAPRAFRDNAELVYATDFPDSGIGSIGINSLTSCTALERAVLWNATSIDNYAFQSCTSLASIKAPLAVTLGNYAFEASGITEADFPKVTSIGQRCFRNCASLATALFPAAVTIDGDGFNGCASLATIEFPVLKSIGSGVFTNAIFTTADMPELETVGNYAFNGCTSMTSANIPKATSIGTRAFGSCTGIEEVTFGPLETVASDSFNSWTFYESDGTTTIDKTDAAALAGKTFQGTAAALVEVAPGLLSLTPQQLQQVQLHTQELQQQELDIQPLPFQPTVQTQDQEPVSA